MISSKTNQRIDIAYERPFMCSSSCCCFVPDAARGRSGAVAMQVERIIKIAIMEYNSAMRDGDAARWNKYFTDNVKRNAPQASQDGIKAFGDYYAVGVREFRCDLDHKKNDHQWTGWRCGIRMGCRSQGFGRHRQNKYGGNF